MKKPLSAKQLPITILNPLSPEENNIVIGALQDLVTRLNDVPNTLVAEVISDLVLSACCAQPDPIAAFGQIYDTVVYGFQKFLGEEELLLETNEDRANREGWHGNS